MTDIKVVLADDHPIVRQGIRNLLDHAVGIRVVAEAATGRETLAAVAQESPDVLLLDMEMPDLRGVDVAKQLAEERPELRILALSSYADITFISEMLASGASGYLLKDEVPGQIIEAVRGVARGEKGWLSRQVASKLSAMMNSEKQSSSNLTPREMEVLGHIVKGKTNAEIGFELGISDKTVEKHLDGIYRKLDVSSRVEAAVLAVREGLFEEED
jgi:DNA-binding NarL/FixJ family response regulator